jgi:hypothetical protein
MFRDFDCGYRNQREADKAQGICPDCGDYRNPRCHCDTPEREDDYPASPIRPEEGEPEYPF